MRRFSLSMRACAVLLFVAAAHVHAAGPAAGDAAPDNQGAVQVVAINTEDEDTFERLAHILAMAAP